MLSEVSAFSNLEGAYLKISSFLYHLSTPYPIRGTSHEIFSLEIFLDKHILRLDLRQT